MRQHVILVASRDATITSIAISLKWAGYDVTRYSNPHLVLDDLGEGLPVDVLVTQVELDRGHSNSISLGLMARQRRPGFGLVFIGSAEFQRFTPGLGQLIIPPCSLPWLRHSTDQCAPAVRASRQLKLDGALRNWASGASPKAEPCTSLFEAVAFGIFPAAHHDVARLRPTPGDLAALAHAHHADEYRNAAQARL
jgi:hypothetical protein